MISTLDVITPESINIISGQSSSLIRIHLNYKISAPFVIVCDAPSNTGYH